MQHIFGDIQVRLLFLIAFLLFVCILPAQVQQFEWGKYLENGGIDDRGKDIILDDYGYVYVAGEFSGSVDFDPSVGEFILSSNDLSGDCYVAKFNSSGDLIWAKIFGGSNYDLMRSMTRDVNGNLIIAGNFSGTVDFDPGPQIFEVTSNANTRYLLKLTSEGEFVWVKHLVGGTYYDVESDNNGDIYVTHWFGGTQEFDPGPGSFTLTASPEGADISIAKYSSSGQFIWAKALLGNGIDFGRSLKVDNDGSVYLAGYFENIVDFDPNEDQYLLNSQDGFDIFILKLNSEGRFLWAKSFGGSSSDFGYDLHIDSANNLYLAGKFWENLTINTGINDSIIISSSNSGSGYVMKLDSNGNFFWIKQVGNWVRAIDGDNSGKIYLIGDLVDTFDFDPGPDDLILTPISRRDLHLSVFSSNGEFLSAQSMPSAVFGESSSFAMSGEGVSVDNSGNIYIVGWFDGHADLDPGSGTTIINASIGDDILIVKFGNCREHVTVVTQSACESYTWPVNGQTYTSSGEYDFIFADSNSCDSIVRLDLTIYLDSESAVEVVICDSYIAPSGALYTTSGIYIDTISNSVGCDSLISIDLTILNNSSSSIDVTECGSYISPSGSIYTMSTLIQDTISNSVGCDSIITIDLTILQGGISSILTTACDIFTAPSGAVYVESGTVTDVIPGAGGCDSVITILLTIHYSSIEYLEEESCFDEIYVLPDGSVLSGPEADTIFFNGSECDSILVYSIYLAPDCESEPDEFQIYNLFTPNGDGVNDLWIIDGLSAYPDNSLKILNRWGDVVFEAEPYINDWDGRSSTENEFLPSATYWYLLELGDIAGTVLTGDVTIIR